MIHSTTARTATKADSRPSDLGPDALQIDRELRSFSGRRVAVALSGGVDSAVAALRLKAAGALPIGLSLRLHDPDPTNPLAPRACCPPDDLQDARRVAERLDFPFYVIDAREAFDAHVVRPFVRDYLDGRTPNPCVGCNSFVKLNELARRARILDCAALATGHYARSAKDAARKTHLYRGVDRSKDQSYFLFGTPKEVLELLIFPLGAMSKDQVRAEALDAGLPVAHKLDSQEVCFVGGAGAGDYVLRRPEAEGDRSGPIVGLDGRVLGRHRGVAGFTIGQAKGLGIGGAERRLHVIAIDADAKRVVVGEREALLRRGLFATDASWPSSAPAAPFRAEARIRYRSTPALATVTPGDDSTVEVRFDQPVSGVAPGQAAVFYDGDEVLGGAWIKESIA